MALIPKPSVNVRWAENGNQLEPASEVQELGFVVEKPPYEVVNWLHNKHDTSVAYLYQEGFAAWDIETEYSNTSYVKYNGIIYKAKLQNTGKQPDTNPNSWIIAFANYQDFTALQTDLNNTKTKAGHAANLVYKSAPVLSAKAVGTSFSANSGIGTNDGYQFNSHSRDGLFHNGANPVVLNDGTTVASFSGNINTPAAKDVVTFDMLQKYIQIYAVGDLYLTTSSVNPSVKFGYGTWARYAEGRALVGFSSSTSNSIPEWVKLINSTHGSYTHSLTIEEMPRHSHGIKEETGGSSGGGGSVDTSSQTVAPVNLTMIQETGGGKEHNNVQPSIVVFVWRRIS